MRVVACFLDTQNSLLVGDVALGELIRKAGKEALWEPRREGIIDTVVIHYISAVNCRTPDPFALDAILPIFVDYGVSSHYLIDRHGVIYHLVPEEQKAWHCGGSVMPPPDARRAVNDFSLGIELVATCRSGYTEAQYVSCAGLCRDIERRYGPVRYVGHDEVAGERAVAMGLRADIREDPGELFDWQRFHRARLSLQPESRDRDVV